MFWGKNTKIHGIAKTNPLLYRSIHSEAKQLLKRTNLKKIGSSDISSDKVIL